MEDRNDNSGSILWAAVAGAAAGIAFMALTDRSKRRSLLSTAQSIKDKAVQTKDEIKGDLRGMAETAKDRLEHVKNSVTEDLEDTDMISKKAKPSKSKSND